MTPVRRSISWGIVLLLLLPSVAMAFWGRKSDEEELKAQLDNPQVHLYLAGKAAVAQAANSEESRAVRERLLVVVGGVQTSVSVSFQGADAGTPPGLDAGTVAVAPRPLTLEDVGALAKALWDMREVGAQALMGEKNSLPPVLPVLLAPLPVPPEWVSRIDRPTDHAVLFAALALLKLHPDSPVPLPPELVLYEASRTEPSQVKIPGFAPQLSALKTYTLAMSGLCDLAEKEAASLEALGAVQEPQLAAGLKLLTGQDVTLTAEQRAHLHALTRVLAYGSLARCHLQRDVTVKAQVAMGLFLDAAEADGVDLPELQLLRASLECGSESPEKGKTRLAALARRGDLSEQGREGLKQLEGSCTKGSGELKGIAGRVKLGRIVVLVAWSQLQRSGLLGAFAEEPWVKAVADFLMALGNITGKVPGRIQISIGGSWDT
jgi:hypothetical protein